MAYLGNAPTAVPLEAADLADNIITSAKIVDGAVTAGDLNATLNLGSKTVTLPATSVTDHVTATDLTPVNNDIALLALQAGINGNLSAYGLQNSWIEQFENSTFIENLSTANRDTNTEYMQSGTVASTARSLTAKTSFGNFDTSGTVASMTDGLAGTDGPGSTSPAALGGGVIVDMGSSQTINVLDWGNHRTNGEATQITVTHSLDDSAYTAWDFSSASGSTVASTGSVNAFASGTSAGVVNTSGFSGNGHKSIIKLSGMPTVTARYIKVTLTGANFVDWATDFNEIKPYGDSSTISATGSFNSTDVVPQDAVNKSSVGLVVLYKNQAGTATLNSHLVAKVRANTGQAYQTLVLASAGTYSDGMKIAIAPAIAVTAGQALSYEISFASQSSGSIETRVHGVAMTY